MESVPNKAQDIASSVVPAVAVGPVRFVEKINQNIIVTDLLEEKNALPTGKKKTSWKNGLQDLIFGDQTGKKENLSSFSSPAHRASPSRA